MLIRGLMDHWVPSHQNVSSFWKTPMDKLIPELDRVIDEMNVNHFTFYTKWYTNGIKSSLPFLTNNPESMNTVTENKWGEELIAYLHSKGATVGAMLQCFTFEKGLLPDEAVLGTWDLATATGIPEHTDIASPTWQGNNQIIASILEEHLKILPDLDAVFLEFEGFSGISAETASEKLGLPTADETTEFSGPVSKIMAEIPSLMKNDRRKWLWTAPAQELFEKTLKSNLAAAEEAMTASGFKGLRGIVYNALGYELPYVEQCIPTDNWWLLPWKYWGWNTTIPVQPDDLEKELSFFDKTIKEQQNRGFKICYVGNATLPTANPESIERALQICSDNSVPGYIGMGNFIPDIGLKWRSSTPQGIETSKKMHKKFFLKS